MWTIREEISGSGTLPRRLVERHIWGAMHTRIWALQQGCPDFFVPLHEPARNSSLGCGSLSPSPEFHRRAAEGIAFRNPMFDLAACPLAPGRTLKRGARKAAVAAFP